MTQIVPQKGVPGQRFARLLDLVCPITDDTRFTITALGIAALDADPSPNTQPSNPPLASPSSLECPKCNGLLSTVNLYCGGRGYVPFDSCTECDYQVRCNNQARCNQIRSGKGGRK